MEVIDPSAPEPVEVVRYDTFVARFRLEVGAASSDATTKARTFALMLSQMMDLDTIEVEILTAEGESASAALPLTEAEVKETQLAIAKAVRETDPELSDILTEAAGS